MREAELIHFGLDSYCFHTRTHPSIHLGTELASERPSSTYHFLSLSPSLSRASERIPPVVRSGRLTGEERSRFHVYQIVP